MIKCTHTRRKFKVDFLENKDSDEKFLFYIFDLFFSCRITPLFACTTSYRTSCIYNGIKQKQDWCTASIINRIVLHKFYHHQDSALLRMPDLNKIGNMSLAVIHKLDFYCMDRNTFPQRRNVVFLYHLFK